MRPSHELRQLRLLAAVIALIVGWQLIGASLAGMRTASVVSTYETADDNTLHLHVPAFGDYEVILLRCGNEALLVGAGPASISREVVRYISRFVKGPLHGLVLIDDEEDHAGGVSAIISTIGSRHIFDAAPVPGAWDGNGSIASGSSGAAYSRWEAGSGASMSCAEIKALAPIADPLAADEAAGPLPGIGGVLLVASGQNRALIAGQLSAAGETSLLRLYPDLQADLLITGRQGHKNSSSRLFLERIRPRIAVIVVGVYNEEQRPHAEVLERLQAVGARIYRTDRDGTLIFRFENEIVPVPEAAGRSWGRER